MLTRVSDVRPPSMGRHGHCLPGPLGCWLCEMQALAETSGQLVRHIQTDVIQLNTVLDIVLTLPGTFHLHSVELWDTIFIVGQSSVCLCMLLRSVCARTGWSEIVKTRSLFKTVLPACDLESY